MKDFARGVGWYTKATVEVGFPEDDIVCHWCPFLTNDYKLDRARCNKTGEVLIAPKHQIGYYCPLRFEGGDEIASEN